ncbi:naDP-specific glutamate dehydrogenase [Cardiosporidium cionae]|uniref:Glutamate dehydrogenase n=1 Tax=Cardiosporidium cionae TaxID=476202 RepID=A0ABQ7JDS7_9APIC|nr:naDP-specific glutamate dehydrogenase [Cardiosporidium cionae]|eukprot:KAF8822029.1 naDP-specific glutamate dehydrogenase [Cardiosporidium cionae]
MGENNHAILEDKRLVNLFDRVRKRDPNQTEFLQAVHEVFSSIEPVLVMEPKYLAVIETIVEAERTIIFRVPWVDDQNKQQVNRGFRVQFSSTLGPYKGGLRFHPSVNLSILKFLGFEQIFKNSLTGLPLGGGKGGSDFDPKGKSDGEVLRFCQSFMTALSRHIGANTDVPAGDIGVGAREIGYLFGQYKRIANHFEGVLTGKGLNWGGSNLRPEATGYGAVYFLRELLSFRGDNLNGKFCVISGSGNVAQHAAAKLLEFGAKVLTFSDSSGFIYEESGFTLSHVQQIMHLKNVERGRISEFCKLSKTVKFFSEERPWRIPCDVAFPCATQNEIDENDAKLLCAGGCSFVVEGANMPTTAEAVKIFEQRKVILCPAKAANAGGVAVSGLEMSQNSARLSWEAVDVDNKLQNIMRNIFTAATEAAEKYTGDAQNLLAGANIAGFLKVADALIDQGLV